MTKTNPGRFFEDYRLGQVIRHAVPRTVAEGERALYHALYPARHALYSSDEFASDCGLESSPMDDLLAFYLYAADGMGTRVTAWIRHPQLTGFSLWAVAHLLVNGDLPSFILFGGLLVWALVEIVLLNRAGAWKRRTGPFPLRKEIMAAAGAVIVMLVVGLIHGWIGPWPFGG